MTASSLRLIIISGRSGSGKSTVLNTLEDTGFVCIDNLPPELLPKLVEWMATKPQHTNLAVCIDARVSPDSIKTIPSILQDIKSLTPEILYLDADDNILLQRFSATRRKHPLTSDHLSLAEAIAEEGKLLVPLTDVADLKIDTSSLSLQDLREQIRSRMIKKSLGIAVQFVSFGYKHGLPRDADLVFDVRCLPNPYWDKSLRLLTGQDEPIQTFLQNQPAVGDMYGDICAFLSRWIKRYETGQRSYLTIAIGCTGGQHRSVYMVEKLHQRFHNQYAQVQIRHRDLGNDDA